ncbi:MAG: glycogen synthase [Erysipelotrichaceae bacterium]
MTKILFAASEALPFSKTGGLADVVSALPKSLAAQGHEVAIFLPLYLKNAQNDHSRLEKVASFQVQHGLFDNLATIYRTEVDGVTYFFVEHQPYFEREGYYGYDDDGLRFAFFQVALLESFQHLDYFPEILHANDWQTGMLATLCYQRYPNDARYQAIKHILTIHNLAFQGNFPVSVLTDCLGLHSDLYTSNHLKFHDGISFLKAGIMDVHAITTVSKTYSHEILTDFYGENMQHVLKQNEQKLHGIINGIDVELFDPSHDAYLPFALTNQKDKFKHKAELQKFCHMRQDKNTLLCGMVTRLSHQKGISLLLERIHDLMSQDIQLVILGSGDSWMEQQLYDLQHQYPRRLYYYRGYNEGLAHQIYAGIDLFLMPSLFEPCGISQMIAMRYGTLVYARKTGGLHDTVIDYNEFTKQGYGFTFTHFDGNDWMFNFKRCVDTYYDHPTTWSKMQRNLRRLDFSFDKSAKEYAQLYVSLLTAE